MSRVGIFRQAHWRPLLAAIVILCCAAFSERWVAAQASGLERTFPQTKSAVEKAIGEIQSAAAGSLPALAGFATAGDHPLDRYQRGYYQAKFQVSASPSGGSTVRVTVEVTAWYAAPAGEHSGYQLLNSNGRLEGDLLDQLADQLAGQGPVGSASTTVAHAPFPFEHRSLKGAVSSDEASSGQTSPREPEADQPVSKGSPALEDKSFSAETAVSAPVPQMPKGQGGISSSVAQTLADQEKAQTQTGNKIAPDDDLVSLRAEAASLEEILKNQAHPENLVAVRKNGTPVVEIASLNAKTLFLASAHDEFEMLDYTRDWVHVRISGLSRGWIWRTDLEMPYGVPDNDAPPSPVPVAAELYHVTREETAPFPGDWSPLRGKYVKIVSVEKVDESEKDDDPRVRLEFAKSVLDKDYANLNQKPLELAGIALIFDSADGGMIAATAATLQQWKSGRLSDAALWHQCFFDPPETFSDPSSSSSQ